MSNPFDLEAANPFDLGDSTPKQGYGGDLVDAVQAGAIGGLADIAQGVTRGDENLVSKALRDWGDSQYDTMSPESVQAMHDTGINDDLSIKDGSSFKGAGLQFAQGLGSFAPSMAPGAIIGRGLNVATKVNKLSKGAQALAKTRNATIGHGVGGAAMIGGSTANQAMEEVRNAPLEQLSNSDEFVDLFMQSMNSGLGHAESIEAARESYAKQQAEKSFLSGAAIGGVSMGVGGPILEKVIAGKAGASRLANAATGAVTEGIQEFSEGFGQQVAVNTAAQDFDTERDTYQGAVGEGATGAVVGAGLGGGLGAAFHRKGIDEQIQEDKKTQQTKVSEFGLDKTGDIEKSNALDVTESNQLLDAQRAEGAGSGVNFDIDQGPGLARMAQREAEKKAQSNQLLADQQSIESLDDKIAKAKALPPEEKAKVATELKQELKSLLPAMKGNTEIENALKKDITALSLIETGKAKDNKQNAIALLSMEDKLSTDTQTAKAFKDKPEVYEKILQVIEIQKQEAGNQPAAEETAITDEEPLAQSNQSKQYNFIERASNLIKSTKLNNPEEGAAMEAAFNSGAITPENIGEFETDASEVMPQSVPFDSFVNRNDPVDLINNNQNQEFKRRPEKDTPLINKIKAAEFKRRPERNVELINQQDSSGFKQRPKPQQPNITPTHEDNTGEQYLSLGGGDYQDGNGETWAFDDNELTPIAYNEAAISETSTESDINNNVASISPEPALNESNQQDKFSQTESLTPEETTQNEQKITQEKITPIETQSGEVVATGFKVGDVVSGIEGSDAVSGKVTNVREYNGKQFIETDTSNGRSISSDKFKTPEAPKINADSVNNVQNTALNEADAVNKDNITNAENQETTPEGTNSGTDNTTNGVVESGSAEQSTVSSEEKVESKVDEAVHIEGDGIERVTPEVINDSAKDSVSSDKFTDKRDMQDWLISEVDKAITDSKPQKHYIGESKPTPENLKDAVGYKTFDIAGDGKFKVLNTKEHLAAFKKKVLASKGFKETRAKAKPRKESTKQADAKQLITQYLNEAGKKSVISGGKKFPIKNSVRLETYGMAVQIANNSDLSDADIKALFEGKQSDIAGKKELLRYEDGYSTEETKTETPKQEVKAPAAKEKIDDVGQKLGGAKKDKAKLMRETIPDEDIAKYPLSKVFPKVDVSKIDDPFKAALAIVVRKEIPSKPRKGYLVKAWAKKVAKLRKLVDDRVLGELTMSSEVIKAFISKAEGMETVAAKVNFISKLDKENMDKVDVFHDYSKAYDYDSDGKKVYNPSVYVNGKMYNFKDSVDEVVEAVNSDLSGQDKSPAKEMQFQARGRKGAYFIHKKGDKEYRHLMEFTDSKDALAYLNDNNEALVAAWDAVKARDNIGKGDIRKKGNDQRVGKDYRNGKDVDAENFRETFGFKGVEFGLWVKQGKNSKERQGMINQAYDALMDLSDILNIPKEAISLNGTMGLGFGSRGSGGASAHFEPDNVIINLTKTKGAGSLAHEWFHALDNYFSRARDGEVAMERGLSPQMAYRKKNYITYRPEPMYIHKDYGEGSLITKAKLEMRRKNNPSAGYFSEENFQLDPSHPKGVRPEVETAFANLVETLDESPMMQRSAKNDKAAEDGYWSRIIERAARSFENYVISTMLDDGNQNDYLANVKDFKEFTSSGKSDARYPYLKADEIKPVKDAFDNLFKTIKSKKTDKGTALYSKSNKPQQKSTVAQVKALLPRRVQRMVNAGKLKVVQSHDSGAEALYDESTDTITLIADNLNEDNINSVIQHELFHRARATDKKLQSQLSKLDKQLQQRFNLASKGLGTQADKDAYKRVMDAGTAKADQLEEFQAYLVTSYSKNPDSFKGAALKWMKDLYAAIRAVLIRHGIHPKTITPADLNALANYGAKVSRKNPTASAGKESNTVALASKQGYKGNDTGEAKEWLDAKAKGLDMSHEARMERAKAMGFDVDTTYYHDRGYRFDNGDSSPIDEILTGEENTYFDGLFTIEQEYYDGVELSGNNNFFVKNAAGHREFNDSFYSNIDSTREKLDDEIDGYGELDDEQKDLIDELITEDQDNLYDLADQMGRLPEWISELFSEEDIGLIEWTIQKIRGHLAVDFGFDAVEMKDENGVSTLLLPTGGVRHVTAAFDPDNADSSNLLASKAPKLSRSSNAINSLSESETAEQIKVGLGRAKSGAKAQSFGLLTLRQIADLTKEVLPEIKAKYVKNVHAMDTEKNKRLSTAGEIATDWAKLDKKISNEMSNLMHDSTIAGVDGAERYVEAINTDEANAKIKAIQEKIRGRSGDDKAAMFREIDELRMMMAFEKKRKLAYKPIKARFDGLARKSSEAADIYRRSRDHHESHFNDTLEALKQRIGESEASTEVKGKLINALRLKFESLQAHAPYFPLARFGEYWVQAADGDKASFNMFESEVEQENFIAQMRKEGVEVLGSGKQLENLSDIDGVSAEFITEVDTLISGLGDVPMVNDLRDSVYQLYLNSLPDVSARKHFIHRKKTKGFNQDQLRAFAKKSLHDANSLSKLKFGSKLQQTLDQSKEVLDIASSKIKRERADKLLNWITEYFRADMSESDIAEDLSESNDEEETAMLLQFKKWKKSHSDAELQKLFDRTEHIIELSENIKPEQRVFTANALDELRKSYRDMMNPKVHPLAQKLNSLGFAWFLGLTPAAAIVNTTQTPVVSLPMLAAKVGWGQASKHMLNATKAFGKNMHISTKKGEPLINGLSIKEELNSDELKAYNDWIDSGLLDVTLAHDLAGLSDEGILTNTGKHKMMNILSFGFHHAERMNREITALASYRAGKEKGMNHNEAVQFAADLVLDSHFDYTSSNRARFMRGNVARVATQFKQYSQNLTYLYARSFQQAFKGSTPEEQAEARKALRGMLIMQFSVAGTLGMPMAGVAMGMAQVLSDVFGDDDEFEDLEGNYRQLLADVVTDVTGSQETGNKFSHIMSKGFIDAFTPFSVSGRLSASDLWVRGSNRELERESKMWDWAKTILGPMSGLLIENPVRAMGYLSDGHNERALETMMPKAIKDSMKALRYSIDGVENLRGDKLKEDYSVAEGFGQLMGFASSEISEVYEQNNAISRVTAKRDNRRSKLLSDAANARNDRDINEFNKIWKEVKAFNEKNPKRRILMSNVIQSMKGKNRRSKSTVNGLYTPKRNRDIANKYMFAE